MVVSVRLSNWMAHQALDWRLGRRVLILGSNGLGKSSVVDAIEWCLTGRCRGVDGKGTGRQSLVMHGATRAEVTVEVADVHGEILTVTRTVSVDGSTSCNVPDGQILAFLATDRNMLRAVLYGQVFFGLHHADAKNLLMDVLDVRVPKDMLPGIDLDGYGVGADALDLADAEAVYEREFANRAAAKRDLDNATIPEKPRVQAMESLDAVRQRADEAIASFELAKDAHEVARTERDTAQREADDAKAAAEELPRLEGAVTAHQDMLVENKAKLEKARAAKAELDKQPEEPVDTLQAKIRDLESLAEKISTHDPDRGCVLTSAIPCPVGSMLFQGHVEGIRRQATDLIGRVQTATARAASVAAATAAINEAERSVGYSEGQIEDFMAKVTTARLAAGGLKAKLAELARKQKAVKAAGDQLEQARTAQASAVDLLSTAAAGAAAVEAYKKAVTHREACQAAVDEAERRVKLLGPKGVRLQMLQAACEQFTATINAALQYFDFQIVITPDPWGIAIRKTDGEPIPADLLSKGQRIWVGMAIQIALAKVSGLGMVVLDDVESVVGDNRRLLTGVIMGDQVRQGIVIMAKADNEPAPEIEGLQVIRLLSKAS